MSAKPEETCWTLIQAAAIGSAPARQEFSIRYLEPVRSYLAARWHRVSMQPEIEDAVQEVFLTCLKEGGALSRAEPRRGHGFRAYLFGIVRNIALQHEKASRQRARRLPSEAFEDQLTDDTALSRVYDRAYARAIMREAAARMSERADGLDQAARRRVALLRMRFEDGIPIREIANRWGSDPKELHREAAMAGREFKAVLRKVVGLAERCAPEHLDRECGRLLELLG